MAGYGTCLCVAVHRVVFSKQCDHDSDLFPLWWHWYTEVFRADTIVLTPVRLPTSSVDRAVEFYSVRGAKVHVIDMGFWSIGEIWSKQKECTARYLPTSDFLALSADADQFFEPVPDDIKGDAVRFHRAQVLLDDRPTLGSIASMPMWVTDRNTSVHGANPTLQSMLPARAGFTGAYLNDFNSTAVTCCGHARSGGVPNGLYDFHVTARGPEHFLGRLASLTFQTLEGKGSRHMKAWKDILFRHGPDVTAKAFIQSVERAKTLEVKPLTERFRKHWSPK